MNSYGVKADMVHVCVAGKTVCLLACYRAISECFRDEVRDEVLYKSTFFTLLSFTSKKSHRYTTYKAVIADDLW